MPLLPLKFKPGINRDQTNYSGEGGFFACDKVRFFSGFPQKLGGWVAYAPPTIQGIARTLWNWITTYQDNFLAIGTNSKIYVEAGAAFYDITPLRASYTSATTPSTTNCLDTTNGSAVLNINITTHGANIGDTVTLSGVASSIGGFLQRQLNAAHVVSSVTDVNNFGVTIAPVLNCPYSIVGTTVTCTVEAHGLVTGAVVRLSFQATTGVAPPTAAYSVTVTGPNTLTFTTATGSGSGLASVGIAAGSTVANAGGTTVVAKFQIPPGNAYLTAGYGWGTGGWGEVGWGLSSTQPVYLPQRDWWFDNFDNDLVMNIRNGPIYYWERGGAADPLTPLGVPAALLSSFPGASNVPQQAMQILVSQNDKHLLAFGATPLGGGAFDSLLIRWASQDDPFDWFPTAFNSSGFIRVSRGSRIVRAMPTRQEILVWTESHLYSLQYLGTTDVFGLQEYADNSSIASPRACITVDNVTYWMGKDKFYVYSGRVDTLPCDLRTHVFGNLNQRQMEQIVCGTNEGFAEIWWLYPSAASEVNDSYIIYNYLERLWYYGTINRTAWLDSPTRDYPLAVQTLAGTEVSRLLTHENGLDDDTLPMMSYIQTNDFDLDNGDNFALTKRMLPDINFNGSFNTAPQVTLSLLTRNFPGLSLTDDPDNAKVVAQVAVGRFTDQVFIRARARQLAMRIESNDLGSRWQLGVPRVDVRTDGKR